MGRLWVERAWDFAGQKKRPVWLWPSRHREVRPAGGQAIGKGMDYTISVIDWGLGS